MGHRDVQFRGLAQNVLYGVEDTARCVPFGESRNHGSLPDPGCTCGFYALKDKAPYLWGGDHMLPGHSPLLEVELWGRVLVGTNGYRGEHQRVLSATLSPCHWCGAAAEWVQVPDGGFTGCAAHPPTQKAEVRATRVTRAPILPVSELRSVLGTEVRCAAIPKPTRLPEDAHLELPLGQRPFRWVWVESGDLRYVDVL
jgi:hypothetical protein